MSRKRLFIAVDLPAPDREAIARWIAPVRERARRLSGLDVAWVEPEKLHLTLKFLGSADSALVDPVREAAAAVLASQSPFELAIEGTGTFPPGPGARVLWLGVRDSAGRLAGLAGALERALVPLGFAPEERPFSAHLTIGRVKRGRGADALFRGVSFFTASFAVSEAVLYESKTLPSGSIYAALARLPLSPGAGLKA
ncbi:MAG: RNA 2',3'-cyclic phosphodiesterase [Oligoflexia bacterium]|nr:RNA 2',3'-cyclic phosphodiesterase [Oligoflexia bacterium]